MDMPTVLEANAYHDLRGNAAWAAIGEADKPKVLQRAADYVRLAYTFVSTVTADEPLYKEAVMMVAPTVDAVRAKLEKQAGIKSQKLSSNMLGGKETVYSDEQADPYPLVTALLRPITVTQGSSGGGAYMGTLAL